MAKNPFPQRMLDEMPTENLKKMIATYLPQASYFALVGDQATYDLKMDSVAQVQATLEKRLEAQGIRYGS
jgi:hypothetical protein